MKLARGLFCGITGAFFSAAAGFMLKAPIHPTDVAFAFLDVGVAVVYLRAPFRNPWRAI